MKREPLRIAGYVVAFVQAVLSAVVLMGWWGLTPEQTAGWMAVIALGGTVAVVLWTRGKVTPLADPRDNNGNYLAPVQEERNA